MKKNYTAQCISFWVMLLFCSVGSGQTLLHYWNFNNNSSVTAITTPTYTLGNATINAIPGGISVIDYENGTGQNFNVDNVNTRNGDASGAHLRFNDPIGGALEFSLPTTGFENIIVKFATRRSGSGAGTQSWYYSLNGTDYTFFQEVFPNNGNPELATLDFSTIAQASNNPNFKLKVTFAQGSGGTVGNNRFDNYTVEGTAFGGADTFPPVVTFVPTNGAVNVATTIQPTIAFNENIRLIDNSPIDNTNVASLLELRLNDATGTLVPFNATISGTIITIIPVSPLSISQTYYLALLSNLIEDESNNAITETNSVTFTTGSPTVAMASNFVTVNETAGTLSFNITLTNP